MIVAKNLEMHIYWSVEHWTIFVVTMIIIIIHSCLRESCRSDMSYMSKTGLIGGVGPIWDKLLLRVEPVDWHLYNHGPTHLFACTRLMS